MKIINSIDQSYNKQYEINEVLKKRVDLLIKSIIPEQWHYISRIKSIESFALKIETARFIKPTLLEDFFACTIVVENTSLIKKAQSILRKHFQIIETRPSDINLTKKESSSFIFDDLRLYVKLKPTNAREKGPINDIKFEIQIKTFLQHAWSIATHDLIYKSDLISWTKQRVSYQVKAMLENAEISIEKASSVKKLPGLPFDNPKIKFQNEIKEFILKNFEEDKLPKDLVRLINNLEHLLKTLKMSLQEIQVCLIDDKEAGLGTNTLNLSPFLIILQSIINQNKQKVISFLKKPVNERYKEHIFIPSEVNTSSISDFLPNEKIITI